MSIRERVGKSEAERDRNDWANQGRQMSVLMILPHTFPHGGFPTTRTKQKLGSGLAARIWEPVHFSGTGTGRQEALESSGKD